MEIQSLDTIDVSLMTRIGKTFRILFFLMATILGLLSRIYGMKLSYHSPLGKEPSSHSLSLNNTSEKSDHLIQMFAVIINDTGDTTNMQQNNSILSTEKLYEINYL